MKSIKQESIALFFTTMQHKLTKCSTLQKFTYSYPYGISLSILQYDSSQLNQHLTHNMFLLVA